MATYRVQLHRGFGFADATALPPYLKSLGVSTLYVSPVFKSRPGSTHGYDVVDPTRLNPELGTAQEWSALLRACRAAKMTVLLDIVPNHMAASPLNPWWWDVLENGPSSPHASFFDIDWNAGGRLAGRVLLPVLTEPLSDVLAQRTLRIVAGETGICFDYNGLLLPLNTGSYSPLLRRAARFPDSAEQRGILTALAASVAAATGETNDDGGSYEARRRARDDVLRTLFQNPDGDSILHVLEKAADSLSPSALHALLLRQYYVLEYWKTARAHLNYRRFFDINDLVGVRVEEERVFEATHGLLRALASHPAVCGFRVDHIDGLYEPFDYLRRLRSISAGSDIYARPYVVVEKILTGNERLSDDWPIEGTTGYEFLSAVHGLFIDPGGLRRLEGEFRALAGRLPGRPTITHASKRLVLRELFAADLRRLAAAIVRLAPVVIGQGAPRQQQIVRSLRDVTARLTVYRTYCRRDTPVGTADISRIREALEAAAAGLRPEEAPARELVRRVLALEVPAEALDAAWNILLSWQQFTGAAMAKGFEDTALYRDAVLLSLNDVGGPPERAVGSVAQFHAFNRERLELWPDTLNCTSTHDTKRGEDARARINVLSEVPGRWAEVARLAIEKLPGLRDMTGVDIDARSLLFLLQTLLGAWPPGGTTDAGFCERFRRYVTKASREAKMRSSWLEPDEDYEAALADCVAALLTDAAFLREIENLEHVVAFHGEVNSLSQTLLKTTCPGAPDFYQGTELWDRSMVDPDNRRPVDYERRRSLLQEVTDRAARDRPGLVRELTDNWPDERAKMFVTWSALQVRRTRAELFRRGSYIPLEASGQSGDHVCAFMRRDAASAVVVIVPRLTVSLCGETRLPLGEAAWGRDSIALPAGSPSRFKDAFAGRCIEAPGDRIHLSEAFTGFSVSMLIAVDG